MTAQLKKVNKTEMTAHIESCFYVYEMSAVMEGQELAIPAGFITFGAMTTDLAFAKLPELVAKGYTIPPQGVQSTIQAHGFTTFTLRRPQADLDADKDGLWNTRAEADYKAGITRHNAAVQKAEAETAAIAEEKARLIAEFHAEMERQATENVRRGSRSPQMMTSIAHN
jgi:hypothetical protein